MCQSWVREDGGCIAQCRQWWACASKRLKMSAAVCMLERAPGSVKQYMCSCCFAHLARAESPDVGLRVEEVVPGRPRILCIVYTHRLLRVDELEWKLQLLRDERAGKGARQAASAPAPARGGEDGRLSRGNAVKILWRNNPRRDWQTVQQDRRRWQR